MNDLTKELTEVLDEHNKRFVQQIVFIDKLGNQHVLESEQFRAVLQVVDKPQDEPEPAKD